MHGIDTKCNNWTDLPVGWLKSRLHMCVYWLHYIVSVKPSTWYLTNSDKAVDMHDHNNDYYTGIIIDIYRKYIRETFRRGFSWLLMYAIIPRDLYMYRPTIIDSCSHDLPMVIVESSNATVHGINIWSRRLPLYHYDDSTVIMYMHTVKDKTFKDKNLHDFCRFYMICKTLPTYYQNLNNTTQ